MTKDKIKEELKKRGIFYKYSMNKNELEQLLNKNKTDPKLFDISQTTSDSLSEPDISFKKDISQKKTEKKIKDKQEKHIPEDRYESNKVTQTKEEKSIEEKNFYIRILKSNLITYYTYGLIFQNELEKCEIVKNETREKDTFNIKPDYLILSDGIFNKLNDNEVLLEVILKKDETEKFLQYKDGIYLLSMPLPVSRINTIYANNNDVIINIKAISKDDVYIPDFLFKIIPDNLNHNFVSNEIDIKPNTEVESLKKKKDKYDRILGMFAFMKNTELYYTQDYFQNYSINYFLALSLLNIKVKEFVDDIDNAREKKFQTFLFIDKDITDPIQELVAKIYENKNIDKQTTEEILRKINSGLNETQKDLVKKAFIELFDVGFENALRILDEDKNLYINYILAVLFKFHKKQSNDKYHIKDKLNIVNKKYSELILALLGLYYGYAILPKQEEIIIEDKYFSSLINKYNNIKFKLETNLDLVIIETVYQYCFNDIISSDYFDYLPKLGKKVIEIPNPPVGEVYKYEEKKNINILGQQFMKIKKINEIDLIIEIINSKYRDIILPQSHLYLEAIKNYPFLLEYEETTKPFPFIIRKKEFIEQLKTKGVQNITLIKEVTDLDIKYNLT